MKFGFGAKICSFKLFLLTCLLTFFVAFFTINSSQFDPAPRSENSTQAKKQTPEYFL